MQVIQAGEGALVVTSELTRSGDKSCLAFRKP